MPHDESRFTPTARRHICEDIKPNGCHFWNGNKCIVDADEKRCAEEYNSGGWQYYKDECLEQLEERVEQENNDVTKAIEEGIDKFLESHPDAQAIPRDVVAQIWLDGMTHGTDAAAGIYREDGAEGAVR